MSGSRGREGLESGKMEKQPEDSEDSEADSGSSYWKTPEKFQGPTVQGAGPTRLEDFTPAVKG